MIDDNTDAICCDKDTLRITEHAAAFIFLSYCHANDSEATAITRDFGSMWAQCWGSVCGRNVGGASQTLPQHCANIDPAPPVRSSDSTIWEKIRRRGGGRVNGTNLSCTWSPKQTKDFCRQWEWERGGEKERGEGYTL